MPNTHSTLTGLFTDIADAIREKDGTTTRKVADAFPAAIRAIPSGGDTSVEDALVERTISAYTNTRVSYIKNHAFYSYSTIEAVSFPACISIYGYAFFSCSALTTVSFPACTSILAYAFDRCTALTAASFPACTYIGSSAFAYCSSITMASFPVCTRINSNAFSYCYELSTAFFPACTMIDNDAFVNCKKLLSLYLYASSVCTLSRSFAFQGTPIGGNTDSTGGVYGSIFVPMSLLSAYKSATIWTYFADRFVGVEPEDM